ncbi:hypothetical protein A2714_02065 [Candidatus Woesebacteria bacterium RIFCSPHIGHO2_01_FULL_38_9]|uniref:Lactamase n=2 Tax=Candidatus Woeseibacteriota TaxID=1752722 RepID=A0A1F7Y366_9BACT|nr:MAG: hypothetical protein A2714_02065 [Candidatus Woesebacteria bacterium RIFCSPHIGHO2_01_FULL_38_9]OGM60201.1 MAG: hypothetical protein A3A75_05785 [Candidatus Woesebacteria bacterium RIFCSPLOWO2_01_FULL_39_10]
MDITYLGHSSFKLKGRLASVVTDPYDPNKVGLKYPKTEAEVVTISHPHDDHNFIEGVSNTRKVIDGPGEYEISGVSIVGISTFHDDKKGEIRGKNTIYIYEIDGIRCVHLGDLGHKLSEDIQEEIGTTDILMIPVGGVYTVGPAEAAEIVRQVEPLITIPMHFKAPGQNVSTFGQLAPVEEFLNLIGLPVEKMEKLSIKRSEFTEEQKVIVLERK